MYASEVCRSRHDPAERVNFADKMTFANPSDSWITTHLTQRFDIVGQQQGRTA
jgi:hypothetical protein